MIKKFHHLLQALDGMWGYELSLFRRHLASFQAGVLDPANEEDWAYESFPPLLAMDHREKN